MTTYRLPEAWGGLEVEESFGSYDSVPDGYLMVLLPRSQWAALFPKDALTEVKPPIPAEPEPGAYLIGEKVCVRYQAPKEFVSWAWPCRNSNGDEDWTSSDFGEMWQAIGGPDVTITPLVPSAPVEPVQLPWEGASKYEAKINVERYQDEDGPLVQVRVASALGCGKSHDWLLSPPVARAMAAALLSAADRSEQ